MRAILCLILLAMLSIVIQPAMAARFYVYVYDDSDSKNPVQDAFIRVWNGNDLEDDGYTDSRGAFITTDLFDGVTYRIKGETYNKWAETTFLADSAKSTEIELYLHN